MRTPYIEVGVGLVHLNGELIILRTDVLAQQVDGFRAPVLDPNL